MKRIIFGLTFLTFFSCQNEKKLATTGELEIFYTSPAGQFEEAIPLGNGRLGAMPTGGIYREEIVLNDITMWSGSAQNVENQDAKKFLPKIKKLLLEGKNLKAQELLTRHFVCAGKGTAGGKAAREAFGSYQMLGTLVLTHILPEKEVENYRRGLSLETAVAYTDFVAGGTQFHREYFVSQTEDVIVIKLSADKKKSVSFSAALSRPRQATVRTEEGAILMEGRLSSGQKGVLGTAFKTKLKIINKGGEVLENKNSLSVSGTDEAFIVISSATNMLEEDYEFLVENLLQAAVASPFNVLKNNHLQAYDEKFSRVSISLGQMQNSQPMDERLLAFQNSDDASLAALFFQFARYLMISSTRENSLPIGLQGLWTNALQTPQNGGYNLGGDLQMSYSLAEVGNLSEFHHSLFEFTKRLATASDSTARAFYNADGWVAHTFSNPWHFSAPSENAVSGASNVAGAWLCAGIWEHFAFTQDKEFLREYFPVLKGAAQFFLSTLVTEKDSGYLVNAPSFSLGNAYFLPKTKTPIFVGVSSSFENQIIKELFNNVKKSAEILNADSALIAQLDSALKLLPPTKIAPDSTIQEWLNFYPSTESKPRRLPQLYGLFPSNQISIFSTPELANAANLSLENSSDEISGTPLAWKISLFARLKDGEKSYELFKKLTTPAFKPNHRLLHAGGVLPNLLFAQGQTQIAANFGAARAIAEMLVQSHSGRIEFFPAMPENWKKLGKFRGLRLSGGATADAFWNDSIAKIFITANVKNNYKIARPKNFRDVQIHKSGITMPFPKETKCLEIEMSRGERLVISCSK